MEQQRIAIREALNHDQAAVSFIEAFFFVCDVWDDLIDKDKPVTDHNINAAFWACLIGLPRNPFYAKYKFELEPVMAAAIQNWHAANSLERSDSITLRRAANVLRNRVFDLVMVCARLIGGIDHALHHGPILASYFYDEPLPEDVKGD